MNSATAKVEQVDGAEQAALTVVEEVAEEVIEVPWSLYKRLVDFSHHSFDCVTVELDFEGDALKDCNCGFAQLLIALSDEGIVEITDAKIEE